MANAGTNITALAPNLAPKGILLTAEYGMVVWEGCAVLLA